MADSKILTGLVFIANCVKAEDALRHLDFTVTEGWEYGDGFRFLPLNETMFVEELRRRIAHLTGTSLTETFIGGVDINLIEVTGKVHPHHHEDSDVVLRCISPQDASVLTNVAGHPVWHPAMLNELVVLPRGALHGFTWHDGEGPLRFIDFNYPPLAETDVVYRG